jgi:hypothetical protein
MVIEVLVPIEGYYFIRGTSGCSIYPRRPAGGGGGWGGGGGGGGGGPRREVGRQVGRLFGWLVSRKCVTGH